MFDLIQQLLGGAAPQWLVSLIGYFIIMTVLLVAAPVLTMALVWMERRAIARMQDRLGPNRVGPAGLFQLIADGVKLFTKEDIVPRAADRWVHLLAPVVTVAPVVLMLAVIPWARDAVPTDINVALLFAVAVASISGVGLLMAGWGSSNKFALLGALRAVAQTVSYEIPTVLALLAAVLMINTMSLAAFPLAQAGLPVVGQTIAGAPDLGLGWFVFTPVGFIGFAIFFISSLSEGERTPFDIPEAESEIVAGHLTEYSGMKFALFYLGQYILNFVLAALGVVVFLGGWQGPGVAWLAASAGDVAAGLLSLFWMVSKIIVLFFIMVLLRGTLPRLRVDQLMGFAWKFLMPLALVNVISAALWVPITAWGAAEGLAFLEGQTPLARQLIAWVVTFIINGAALFWLLQITNQPQEEELDLAYET